MREPSFNQERPRSLLVPALSAMLMLTLVSAAAWWFHPRSSVELGYIHTEILPTTTVFQSNSSVVGANEVNHTLFVASTIHVENKRQYPISLDDFTLTLTDPVGAQMLSKAITRQDLPNLEVEFPKLKPLVANPLLREASIDPGKAVEGTLVFSMPIPEQTWDTRRSAELRVDVYHLDSLYATIPK